MLIAVFGAIPEPAHSLDQLLLLLGRRPFVIWMIFQGLIVVGIIILAASLARFHSIASSPRIRLLRGLAYGCISGILSAHSLLVAKSAVELLVRTIVDRHNQFDRWQSWVILLGLVTLALTQLYFLHRGLKLVSTSVLYPLVFCIYNIIAILDGLIYFHQTSRLSTLSALLITLGTVILLSGVLALSWQLSDEQSPPAKAVTQSALAPGLGLVEDTDNEEFSDDYNADEETALIGESHRALLNNEPLTPRAKLDTILGATQNVRKVVRLTEVDEIWGELDDRQGPKASPLLPKRASTNPVLPAHTEDVENVNEGTSLIRQSSMQRRRRRRSTGFPGFMARPTSRGSRRRVVSQDALGGFWKLKFWRRNGDGRPASSEAAAAEVGYGGTQNEPRDGS